MIEKNGSSRIKCWIRDTIICNEDTDKYNNEPNKVFIMIKLSRRRFVAFSILVSGSALAGLTSRPVQRNPQYPLSISEQALVTRYVDLLIPTDEALGALDLNVHRQIIKRTATRPSLGKLIKQGNRWLNRQARRFNATDFLHLTPQNQIRLIELSEKSPRSRVQRRLFSQLRQLSFHYYYGDSRSWEPLGFRGPPQPLGHLDYQRPPNKA